MKYVLVTYINRSSVGPTMEQKCFHWLKKGPQSLSWYISTIGGFNIPAKMRSFYIVIFILSDFLKVFI